MSKHTPGPWKIRTQNGIAVYAARDAAMGDARPIASMRGTVAQQMANARLVAAAPELLEKIRQYASECAECEGRGYVVTYFDPYGRGDVASPEHSPCGDCADIRALIAKATGAA